MLSWKAKSANVGLREVVIFEEDPKKLKLDSVTPYKAVKDICSKTRERIFSSAK